MSLQAAGLREGDYIVSVNGQPCRWWKHAEVVAQLKGAGDEGVSLQVVTLLPSTEPPSTVSPRDAGGWAPAPGPTPVLPRYCEGLGKRLALGGPPQGGLGRSDLCCSLHPSRNPRHARHATHLLPVTRTRLAARGPGRGADRCASLTWLQGDRRPALRGLLRSQKECGWESPAPARASPRPLLGWSCKAKRGKTAGRLPPASRP